MRFIKIKGTGSEKKVNYFVKRYVRVYLLHHRAVANTVGQPSCFSRTPHNMYYCMKVLGLITIFAVIVGGMLEILRFIIQKLKEIVRIVEILIKKYNKVHN